MEVDGISDFSAECRMPLLLAGSIGSKKNATWKTESKKYIPCNSQLPHFNIVSKNGFFLWPLLWLLAFIQAVHREASIILRILPCLITNKPETQRSAKGPGFLQPAYSYS